MRTRTRTRHPRPLQLLNRNHRPARNRHHAPNLRAPLALLRLRKAVLVRVTLDQVAHRRQLQNVRSLTRVQPLPLRNRHRRINPPDPNHHRRIVAGRISHLTSKRGGGRETNPPPLPRTTRPAQPREGRGVLAYGRAQVAHQRVTRGQSTETSRRQPKLVSHIPSRNPGQNPQHAGAADPNPPAGCQP